MTDRLSSYGYAFQIKVITALLVDKSFLEQISDIMLSSYFESDANSWIIDTILEYHKEYKSSPTLEVMKVKLEKVDHDILKEQIISHLKDAWKYTESPDLEYIKDQAMDFCKNQEIKKAILSSVELLKQGDYDGIKAKVDEALKAGADKDIGHDYMTQIDERYTEAVRDVQETPWEVINELTDGGIGKGELGVMVAPAGIGKSWALINVGAEAIRRGLKVIHYTLELNESYVGLRYDSIFSGIGVQDLRYHLEDIKKVVSKLKGQLIVKQYSTKTASVPTLSGHIEKCRMQGIVPDLVIVDYADLLSGKGRERRIELGNIYEDLRGLAGEQNLPIWTASQANRSSLTDDVIGAEKISEDYSKIMTADFVISLSRKIEDKLAGTGRWHVIKNRFGPDGITFPSKMNASNGMIEIYQENSLEGKETRTDMNNHNEFLRKMLKNKFEEMK